MDKEIYEKITAKKELSKLPKKDVEKAFAKFENEDVSYEEKVRLTRELLNKIFWPFRSDKLLSIKDKDPEWILRKHFSTRERLHYYGELYNKILKQDCSIIDLGAGINGFSYGFFPVKVDYVAVEGVGQLVDLMNYYFKKEKFKGRAYDFSLFELGKIKRLIKKTKKPRVIFLFKVLDNLEMIERDYSKKLLLEIVPLADQVVVSFATQSIGGRTKFKVSRKWIFEFIDKEFKILDDFELGSEKYVVFSK